LGEADLEAIHAHLQRGEERAGIFATTAIDGDERQERESANYFLLVGGLDVVGAVETRVTPISRRWPWCRRR